MSNQITSSFKIENWKETTFSESEDGPKLIRAEVEQSYKGDIEGEGVLEYLITTFDETFSTFIGTERVTGKLAGRTGSFVLSHKGTFEDGVAKSSFQIEEDSGTGNLEGICGEGSYEATHEETSFRLDYDFA
jgi:uncharacterized protein YydD (DUF2326 family)